MARDRLTSRIGFFPFIFRNSPISFEILFEACSKRTIIFRFGFKIVARSSLSLARKTGDEAKRYRIRSCRKKQVFAVIKMAAKHGIKASRCIVNWMYLSLFLSLFFFFYFAISNEIASGLEQTRFLENPFGHAASANTPLSGVKKQSWLTNWPTKCPISTLMKRVFMRRSCCCDPRFEWKG